MTMLRSLLSILLMTGLIYGIYALSYLPVQQRKVDDLSQINSLENEITALKSRVVSLTGTGAEPVFPKPLIWPAETKADAELALQDAVVNLVEQSGITLITFGASGLTRDTARKTVSFEFEAEGQLAQTYHFLAEIEKIEPKVAVGVLRMRPSQSYGDPVDDVLIYTQITLWAFWGDGV